MAINQEDIDKLEKYVELQQHASKNLTSLSETYEIINEFKRNAKFLSDESVRLEKKIKKINEEIIKEKEKQKKLTGKDLSDSKKKVKEIQSERKITSDIYDLSVKKHKEAKNEGKELAKTINSRKVMNATLGSTLNLAGNITKTIIAQSGYLFDQQKSVKMTGLQMGILSSQAKSFKDNIYKSSLYTNQLGVGSKELGQMQSVYSEEIGRSLILTEASLQAMSELAEGTVLGQENAARFAGTMENFGYNVERTRDFMEDAMNKSSSMGINVAKSTKNIEKSLRIAQKYNFKGGIDGVTEMALQATKFKLEIESVAGLAEKVFEPEGAIKMASQLSVLGGAWSALGDPFSLMFKARNDMGGLTKDIIKAAAGTAQFNHETKQFEISSMELHRLRKVADATGMSFDELSKSAKESAKFTEIKQRVSGNFDDDILDFIASKGEFDEKSSQFKVTLDDETVFVDELHKFRKGELRKLVQEKENLKERALQSKTFDEMYGNLINQFKSTLLPGFRVFSKSLTSGLVNFQEFLKEDGVLEGLADFGKTVGTLMSTVTQFVTKNPIVTGSLLLLGKPAMWLARGKMLGMGFNSVASASKGWGASKGASKSGGVGGRIMGTGKGFGKHARRAGRVGGGLSLLSAAGDGFSNSQDDELTGMEALGKTLDQNKFTAAGAIVGSIVPVLGTALGAGIGGLIDNFVVPAMNDGDKHNFDWGNSGNEVVQDFVSRPGQDPISFSSADTLIGMKQGGGIDNHMSKSTNKSNTVKVDFNKPLKITGDLKLHTNDGRSSNINLNDPIFMREISSLIQKELSTALNGKQSPNPVT